MPQIETLIHDPAGRILGVDPRIMSQMPYFLLTNQPNNFVTIPANSSSPFTSITVSGEGPCEIFSFAHEKTGACRVSMQVQDGSTQRSLMNRAVHVDTIFGNGQQPYHLNETLYIDELRSLVINFTDISGSANRCAVALGSKRYLSLQVDQSMELIRERLKNKQYMSMPYWYTFDNGFVDVGVGATVRQTITIGQREHFQIYDMTTVATSLLFDINVIDVARGESIINAPGNTNRQVSAGLILGNANFPFKLHTPWLIQVGQKVDVILTNNSGAPNRIYFTMGGRGITDKMWG